MFRKWFLVSLLCCIRLVANASTTKTIPIVPGTQSTYCNQHLTSMYCFLPTFGLKQVQPFVRFNNTGLRLNTLFGIETATLPLPSPATGVSFIYDPQLGVMTRSLESFGPILGDRAETLGARRLSMGFTYQHFNFDSLDGRPLSQFDLVPLLAATIRVDEFTTFLTWGATQRIDLSVGIPVRTVRMAGTGFDTSSIGPAGQLFCLLPCPTNHAEHLGASGLSDITFRAKGTVWKGERAGIALGVDVRTPTGDPLKFLGSGAFGAKPFVIASYGRSFRRF